MQLRKHSCVNLVRLDLRFRDRTHLQWIGYDHSVDKRRKQPNEDCGIPRLFKHHIIAGPQRSAKSQHRVSLHGHTSSVLKLAIFKNRDLPKGPMYVQTDNSHRSALQLLSIEGSSGSHDNYGFALAAQPGESKGRPDNNTSSQLKVDRGLPAIHAPSTPIPVTQGYPLGVPDSVDSDAGNSMPDNNAAERALRTVALGRKNYLFAGSDAGGERAAAIYTLVETAKLNGLDPEAYLRDLLGRIADHPINKIADLLPWHIAKDAAVPVAA